MANISKINVNNTTYEIVPGNTIYPLHVECGFLDLNNSGIYLPSDKIDEETYTYYCVHEHLPVNFVLKQNETTEEIIIVALPEYFLEIDGSGNITDDHLVPLTQFAIDDDDDDD